MNYVNRKIDTQKKNEDNSSHLNLLILYGRWVPSQIDSDKNSIKIIYTIAYKHVLTCVLSGSSIFWIMVNLEHLL